MIQQNGATHFAELIKFKLSKNSKRPTEDWLKDNRAKFNSKEIYDIKQYNTGILTGKINNVTVIDLDLYKDRENIFINEYDKDFIKNFNTLTIKTPNNGYHLYFKYDQEIKTTTSKYNIDIRNELKKHKIQYSKTKAKNNETKTNETKPQNNNIETKAKN